MKKRIRKKNKDVKTIDKIASYFIPFLLIALYMALLSLVEDKGFFSLQGLLAFFCLLIVGYLGLKIHDYIYYTEVDINENE